MKVAPVSADLLIKLALGALVVGAAVYAVRKLQGAAGSLVDGVWDSASGAFTAAGEFVSTRLNPLSTQNFAYSGVNAFGAAITSDGGFNLGGDVYTWMHGDAGVAESTPLLPYANYDETERLLKRYPSYTVGSGGAAFGLYPKP